MVLRRKFNPGDNLYIPVGVFLIWIAAVAALYWRYMRTLAEEDPEAEMEVLRRKGEEARAKRRKGLILICAVTAAGILVATR